MVTFAEFMDKLQRMLYTLYAYVSIKSNILYFGMVVQKYV